MCDCQQENINPCQDPTPCDCPVKDLSTDCILYADDDLECSGITKNTLLTDVIKQMDAFICSVRDSISSNFQLLSIGNGAKVYKGINGIGQKLIRSITKSGNLITVTENTNDIEVSIDEEALTDFITNLVEPSETITIVAGDGIQVDNTDPLNPIVSGDLTEHIVIPISDMVTNLTTGVSKAYFRIPFDMTLTDVIVSVYAKQTVGSALTFDVNQGNTPGTLTSILSTKVTIDNDAYTSLSASTQPVISNSSLVFNNMITFDIDQVGTPGAKGAVVTLIGTRIP